MAKAVPPIAYIPSVDLCGGLDRVGTGRNWAQHGRNGGRNIEGLGILVLVGLLVGLLVARHGTRSPTINLLPPHMGPMRGCEQ